MVEPMSRKIIALAIVLILIVGVMGVVVYTQFYNPEQSITGPLSIIDDVGRNVTITNYPPQRIVSLAPACTEILFAIGLGDKVVGVDDFSDYPLEVQERVETGNITQVGAFATISLETVVGLEPDLIVATGGVQRVVVESLDELGQPVLVLYPEKFDGVFEDISLVGKATGQVDEAEALVDDMQNIAQEIVDKTQGASRLRVYVEYFFNGGYWSFGSESYADNLIYTAGGVNVFSGFAGGAISTSTEEVLVANPEIIIVSRGGMAEACGLTPEVIKERAGWSEIYAVQNDQIYEIDDNLLSRAGPRLIEGLQGLAKLIHPELFK
jgi:iron complex transport system substrate-binding protein